VARIQAAAKSRPASGRAAQPTPVSLRAAAYEEIKRRIITLFYQPGAYINEARICQDLSIGRTPVHSALQRLTVEGLVEVVPRKGVIVRPVSIDEVRSINEARLFNEPPAARLAAIRANSAEIARLESIVELSRSASRTNPEDLMELDRQFHATIAEATRNLVLAQVLRTLHDRSLRHWFITLSDPNRDAKVAAEHAEVAAAIISRDPELAERTMREHIESSTRVTEHLR
jgi:DNA-binding GntR family transcriptional regulator